MKIVKIIPAKNPNRRRFLFSWWLSKRFLESHQSSSVIESIHWFVPLIRFIDSFHCSTYCVDSLFRFMASIHWSFDMILLMILFRCFKGFFHGSFNDSFEDSVNDSLKDSFKDSFEDSFNESFKGFFRGCFWGFFLMILLRILLRILWGFF